MYHHGFLVGELAAVNEQPKGLPAERPEMGYYGDEFIITKNMLIQQILQAYHHFCCLEILFLLLLYDFSKNPKCWFFGTHLLRCFEKDLNAQKSGRIPHHGGGAPEGTPYTSLAPRGAVLGMNFLLGELSFVL